MTPIMQPIAPPGVGEAAAPVGVENPVVQGGISPQPVETPSVHDMFEVAGSTGDPVSMYSLANKVKGTPYEVVVKQAATTMNKNLKEFENDIRPVVEKGGVSTPEGRIAASKTWETIADKPQKMRAFVEMLMGNPNWRTFVTGGTVKTDVVYDKQGNMLERQTNELGQIVGVKDSASGQAIDRGQLAERGGLVPSLDHALGYMKEKEQQKFNTEALNKSEAATNAYAAKAPVIKEQAAQVRQMLKNLYGSDITDEQRKQIASFSNRSIGYAENIAKGLNALSQKIDNKNVSLSVQDTKALATAMEANGWKFGADGSVVNNKGEAVSKNDLTQAQNTLSNSQNFERQFSQSKKDFIESAVMRDLPAKEKELLGMILDKQFMIEKANMELGAQHGPMPFLMNPKAYELGDQFTRGEASSLIQEFNADAIQMFNAWRQQQLAQMPKGYTPRPGQLEAAFANTPQFKQLKREYAAQTEQLVKRPTAERAATEGTQQTWAESVGVTPQREEPKAEQPKKPAPPKARSIKKEPRTITLKSGKTVTIED